MHDSAGKREQPTVTRPQVIVSQGTVEVESKTEPVKCNGKRESPSNFEQSKNLDKPSINAEYSSISQKENRSEPNISLNVINLTDSEYEFSDDEYEFLPQDNVNENADCPVETINESVNLTTMSDEIIDQENIVSDGRVTQFDKESLKNWIPPRLPPHMIHRLTQRRIYRGNHELREPSKTVRIPVKIAVYGEEITGIIDSGSDRSFLSLSAYQRVKKYQIKELIPDASSKTGVRLGDKSIVRTHGGTSFVIDVGDVYGPQWFSIMPGLSGDLILGMDFWMTFKVTVDPFSKTWTLAGSKNVYPLSHSTVTPSELKILTTDQSERLKAFLDAEFAKFDKETTGKTDLIKHVIELNDPTPYRQKPYRRSEVVRKFIDQELDRLLEKGYITWSNSEWASTPVVAPKGNAGLRFCINYKSVNRQTKKPAYPLHNMRSILSQLHQAKIISTLDLSEAFHQIPMDEESRKYTAFVVEGKCLLEWLRMPYGLTGAPSTFQRLMDKLKRKMANLIHERKLPNKWVDQVFTYLDDWIIVSQDLEEHISILSLVFEVLREANLIVNRAKSSFACKEVKFLGYIIDEFGMRPNPERIQPILDFPVPTDRTRLRQFNGLVNWYHRHLKCIAKVQGPLNKLTSPNVPWKWTDVEQKSFEDVKKALADAPRLFVPKPGQPFILYTDASDFGLGAILVQIDPETKAENLIEVLSRPLRGAELHYTTTEKECLAVVWSVEKLRCYLEGVPFKIVTDHQALQWLHGLKNPTGRLARWAMYLYQHDITVEHRRGTTNEAPDALSRMFDVDEDPLGWEKVIDEIVQNRTQLNTIQGPDWYKTKFKLVETQPDRFPEWKIDNNDLFYYKPDYEKALIDDENPWKKVIKPEDVLNILRENHDLPHSGHLGRDKTLDRIRQNYYWPGMTQDVKSYVEDCETCLKVKYNQNPIKGPPRTRPLLQPWSQLSIDTVVSQTRTKKGNTNVLVVLDLYTKFIELFPMRQRTGKNVVKALDILFDRWGAPKSVLTDNGTEYLNKDVKALLEARGIEHSTTPLNHPQANPVERVNRTIKPMIAAFIKDNHNEWDEHLTKLQFAYNTVPHAGSRVSPFYLNHGREAAFKNIRKPGDDSVQAFDESVEHWVKRLSKIDEFRHQIESRMKDYANKTLAKSKNNKQTSIEIKVGTEVYYPNKKLSNKAEGYSAKFAHRFVGPVYVKRLLGPMVVELADNKDKIVGKYYVTDLKIPRRSLRSQCIPPQNDTPAADQQHRNGQ